MRFNRLTLLASAFLSIVAATSHATIYYQLNMGGNLPGTATAPNGTFSWHNDATYGTVLKVSCVDTTDPDSNSERAEFVASGSNNKYKDLTVYMGWRSYLDLPTPTSGSWNNIMQGKAAGNFTLNHPFYLRADSGTLRLGTDEKGDIWSRALQHKVWFTIVIKIRYSTSSSVGYAEVWYNGFKQTLANGTQQFKFTTWSGSDNNIHWGIYRSESIDGTSRHYMWRPTVASTFAEAAPTIAPLTFEAESLAVENSSGDEVRSLAETDASGGVSLMNDTNAAGDFVTLRIPDIDAGTYQVKVRFKKHPSRGITQVMIGKIGGALGNLGSPIDLYSATPGYAEFTIDSWSPGSTSDKQISFKITGKNSSSSGFTQNIDLITLVPQ